jgi:hypothetical protein
MESASGTTNRWSRHVAASMSGSSRLEDCPQAAATFAGSSDDPFLSGNETSFLQSGLVMSPRGVGTIIGSSITGRVIARIDGRKWMAGGVYLLALSMW